MNIWDLTNRRHERLPGVEPVGSFMSHDATTLVLAMMPASPTYTTEPRLLHVMSGSSAEPWEDAP